jgi:hypothetical protein
MATMNRSLTLEERHPLRVIEQNPRSRSVEQQLSIEICGASIINQISTLTTAFHERELNVEREWV